MATRFLTTREAAEELKCSVPSIRRAIARGTLRAVRIGERVIRIPLSSLERLGGNGKGTTPRPRRRRPRRTLTR